jgi:hypothetical protein
VFLAGFPARFTSLFFNAKFSKAACSMFHVVFVCIIIVLLYCILLCLVRRAPASSWSGGSRSSSLVFITLGSSFCLDLAWCHFCPRQGMIIYVLYEGLQPLHGIRFRVMEHLLLVFDRNCTWERRKYYE